MHAFNTNSGIPYGQINLQTQQGKCVRCIHPAAHTLQCMSAAHAYLRGQLLAAGDMSAAQNTLRGCMTLRLMLCHGLPLPMQMDRRCNCQAVERFERRG
jgi:hypothetical protein